MTKEEVLKQCTIENDTIVKLPDTQLDRKLYLEVKTALELIGGKWKGGKVAGFVFQSNPEELLYEIANGEKRNLKKEFQFFATPSELADKLVRLAEIEDSNIRILEPSAGQGAIVNAIHRLKPRIVVDCYEMMPTNRTILSKLNNINLFEEEDFLNAIESNKYDRIIANPPFTKNQDIIHFKKMYNLLADDGILVCVMSKHWLISNFKLETEFRNSLEDLDAEVIPVEAGTFKESGTNISSVIVVVKK